MKRSFEIFVASMIVMFLASISPMWLEWYRGNTKPSAFFEVNRLFINDALAGEDPHITYDRQVNSPHVLMWYAELYKIEGTDYYEVCNNSGHDIQTTTRKVPPVPTLSWIIGQNCKTEVGKYRLSMVWDIKAVNYPVITMHLESNVFEIKKP